MSFSESEVHTDACVTKKEFIIGMLEMHTIHNNSKKKSSSYHNHHEMMLFAC